MARSLDSFDYNFEEESPAENDLSGDEFWGLDFTNGGTMKTLGLMQTLTMTVLPIAIQSFN